MIPNVSTKMHLFGVDIDAVGENATLETMLAWRAEPERKSKLVITVNVAILMMARRDVRLAEALSAAELVVADGMPLVWASRAFKTPLPERVSGVDLMQRLLSTETQPPLRIFLFGSTRARLNALRQVIADKHPGVIICGWRDGYFEPAERDSIARHIAETGPDILLIGMPAPFKEVWSHENRPRLNVPVILGVGGAFDVLAGFVPRAPKVLQSAGLEWLWRLILEPRKLWRRYLVTNSQFLALFTKEIVRRALARTR